MILVTQGCSRVYFTDSDDVLEVQDNRIVLTRESRITGGSITKSYIMGEYSTPGRAVEVLCEAVNNLDAGGLIFPNA